MRIPLTVLVIGLGVFALSINAQTPSQSVQIVKPKFLQNIKVGEKIVTRGYPSRQGISITVITNDEQLNKLVRSEDETRLYSEINKILGETGRRGLAADVDKLSDELKAIYKKHGSFSMFITMVLSKASSAHTITRVGEDFFAYGHGDEEIFVPLHQIYSIKRPAAN